MTFLWILLGVGYFLFNLITTLMLWEENTPFQRVLYLFLGFPIVLLAGVTILLYALVTFINPQNKP